MHTDLISSKRQAPTTVARPWLWFLGFALFFILILIIRVQVFERFNMQVIDSDQPYMWLGAADYARGVFMEPRYYGQDYNTFLEALVAVPLLWLGVPVYKALPIASNILSLFPFFFAATYLFTKGYKVQALMAFSVLLCLPVSYDMLCSMPRGFVTGIFFCSFFIVSVIHPQHTWALVFNSSLAVLAYFVSPNSVVVSLPFLGYVFIQNYQRPVYYLLSSLSIVPMFCLCYLLFDRFYKLHPDYVMNDLTLRFSTDYFPLAMARFQQFFSQLSFFVEGQSVWLFVVLTGLTVYLVVRKNSFAWAMLLFFCFLFFSFCFGKTQDGSDWLFMPLSRMYLGIPLLIVLALPFVQFKGSRLWFFLLLAPLGYGTYKLGDIERSFQRNEPLAKWTGVRLINLNEAIRMTEFFRDKCRHEACDVLLVSHKYWMNTLLVYGGPALFNDYPQTQETYRDKRYWARIGNADKVFPTLVLVSSNFNIDKEIPQGSKIRVKRLDDYGMYLVEGNQYTTDELCHLISNYEE